MLLAAIESQEVSEVPEFGTMLLPGAAGFMRDGGLHWQFNPSYLPMPVLRRLAALSPRGPWSRIAANTATLVQRSAGAHGLAPDWIAYAMDTQGAWAFTAHPEKGSTGSYDAIRTYLWAGMTPRNDALAPVLRRRLGGMAAALRTAAVPPEKVQTVTGQTDGQGPAGFSAALLPYLRTLGATAALKAQQERVRTQLLEAPPGGQPPYYDQVLGLFGTGWMDQRYQFLPSGRLQLRWEKACPQRSATTKTP